MKQNQPAQFKRTNIKVIKPPTSQQQQTLNGPSSKPMGSARRSGEEKGEKPPRVINLVTAGEVDWHTATQAHSAERAHGANSNFSSGFKSMSQEPQSVRSISGKRQFNFKKVANTAATRETTYAPPDQIQGLGNSSTKQHKLYLPKKQLQMARATTGNVEGGGVQLQDGHRRRLQALAAAQHDSGNAGAAQGPDTTSSFNNAEGSFKGGGRDQSSNSNSTSGTNRLKVISKKLITMGTKGRNEASTTYNTTQNGLSNMKSLTKNDGLHHQLTNSAGRPSNLNYNSTGNVSGQASRVAGNNHVSSGGGPHHSSALSRFNGTVKQKKLKAGGTSAMHTHRENTQMKKIQSGPQSVIEHPLCQSDGTSQMLGGGGDQIQQLQTQIHGSINIRQEPSPNRTVYKSQPVGNRKYPQGHQGLGYRRHQIIQDITDESSPQAPAKVNFSTSGGYVRQQQQVMVHQSSDSSMKSLKQIAQALNKQTDLKKVFYAKISQSPSTKSINTMQSNQSSGGPTSALNSQQQFTLTKKASLISQDVSASTSRERTLNFKLKKHGQHGQLQNHKEKQAQLQQQQQQPQQIHLAASHQAASMVPPSVGKRRPLVIRKNNFVLTKGQDSNSQDSLGGNAPGSTTQASGLTRVRIVPLGAPSHHANKLNMTLISNNSGNRAMNNTQKIGRTGANGHAVNSNDSMGSCEMSLSLTRKQLGKTLADVNTSIKNEEVGLRSSYMQNSSKRNTSEGSFEKLPGVNGNQQSGSRLIKVNRSKKKLDTARRSRIQQLKDINVVDHQSHPLQQQLASTLQHSQPQTRGIPQLNKNHSNEIHQQAQPKLATSNLLQVQTDFGATMPIHIHKPAGSITIKGDVRSRPTQGGGNLAKNLTVDGQHPDLQAKHSKGNSAGKLGVSNFNTSRNARNSQNGLRPVRLFNYASSSSKEVIYEHRSDNAIASRQQNENQADSSEQQTTGPSKGQPTPTSAKSQKSLRRGQIFRKQTRRNSQINDESSNTKSQPPDVLTHMTTPTDAQNASSSQLPLKPRRSNQISSHRQQESDKNQQSGYFTSSQGDKVGTVSKPEIKTQSLSGQHQKFSINQPRKMKPFDSERQLALQQQKSANELMKNDKSELIVATANLIGAQQNSSEAQILALKNTKLKLLEKTPPVQREDIPVQLAPESEERPQETSREPQSNETTQHRQLEKVRSSKDLLFDEEKVQFIPINDLSKVAEEQFDVSKVQTPDQDSPNVTEKKQIITLQHHKMEKSPGRNQESFSGSKTHEIKLVLAETRKLEVASSSGNDDDEPLHPELDAIRKPEEITLTQSNQQQDQLRIQHNETLPPPGPSTTSGHTTSGKANQKNTSIGLVNKFNATKGSDLARELLSQTADTSNRKTISNQRAYCNSSDSRVNIVGVGTAFSFKSHTSPENQQEVPQFPMTPQQALVYFSNQLTDYEKREILDYPQIYFIGAPTAQKVQGSAQLEHNYGYDDDKGDYKVINNDHIGFRFEIKSFLGKGSFGTALKCFDHKHGVDVAVKVVKNKKKYYYQAGVELKILQFLKENDPEDIMNVIHLNDYVVFRKHLCIGFELMSMNLFEFLKINDFNGFDHNLIRRFAIQLLYALKYLKMFQIIHCDLKPENILLKESNKSGIKIIDFGSSTFLDERVYTYIQSRFYRAPEIMLGIPYDTAIDMWSFGCIMAELYIGYPIFPGDSENDQMSRLMEMVDVPNPQVLSQASRKDKFFTKSADGTHIEPIMCKNSRGKLRKPMGKPLALVIGDEDPDFTDFVQKCLCWNPQERLSPDEALKHVWVLKGLPPQVLIHHQKMHNIQTPELPLKVLTTRNEFIEEQRKVTQAEEQHQHQQPQLQKQQSQQRLPEATPSVPKSPSGATTTNRQQTTSGSQERPGKIRLKRVGGSAAKQGYNTQPKATLLAPSQVVLNQHNIPTTTTNAQQQSQYPGSTKSANKAKSLGPNGKMSFKIQQNSNAARPGQVKKQPRLPPGTSSTQQIDLQASSGSVGRNQTLKGTTRTAATGRK